MMVIISDKTVSSIPTEVYREYEVDKEILAPIFILFPYHTILQQSIRKPH